MQTLYYYTKNYIRFINIYFININLKYICFISKNVYSSKTIKTNLSSSYILVYRIKKTYF
jgi:hypothetical protein